MSRLLSHNTTLCARRSGMSRIAHDISTVTFTLETMMIRFALAASLLLATPLLAQDKIAADAHVTEVLLAARVGDVIRNTCPTASARMFTVLAEMSALKSYAIGQGYTEPEVKAFLKDPAEKERIKGLASAYLAKAGAVEGDAESYCKVGRAEVAAGSLTGKLLRVR